MTTRYFTMDAGAGPYVLFRLTEDPDARTLGSEGWITSDDDPNRAWRPYPRVIYYLTSGDPRMDEVPEATARELFPAAFVEPVDDMALVSKADTERRYTLGPMYVPESLDAHAEWTDADELQKAVWEYVRKGDRRIRLQHDRDVVAGEFVEVMTWPYAITVPMQKADGATEDRTFPADTVFLGVVWEPWAWEMVKAGKLRGYSIGGRAQRVYVDLPPSDVQKGDPTVNDVHVDTTSSGKRPRRRRLLGLLSDDPKDLGTDNTGASGG